MKTTDGVIAAIETKYVVGVRPSGDGFQILLRKENGEITSEYFDISQEEAARLIQTTQTCGGVSLV